MDSADPRERPPGRGSRFVLAGTVAGGLIGLLFALAVISFADCAGPGCTGERITGVLGHVLGGAVLGAAFGAVAYGLWRAVRWAAGR